jgi:hypothetical protein
MSNGSRRLSRGDRRRNDRLAWLRAVVTRETAVLAFDLAADKQVCALTDQDSRVLARRTVSQGRSGGVLLGPGRLRADRARAALADEPAAARGRAGFGCAAERRVAPGSPRR